MAVEDPESGQVAYCTVMGNAGIEFGLIAHLGTPGLDALLLLATGAADDQEQLLVQDALSFSLGDRDVVTADDRAVHRALGLRFRGRGAWPLLRRHKPGYLPHALNRGEARFLATCLVQVPALMAEVLEGAPMPQLRPDVAGFIGRRRDRGGTWSTVMFDLPPPPPPPVLEVDEARIRQVASVALRQPLTWQVAVKVVTYIAERGAPAYWAWLLLCVDKESGFVFPTQFGWPGGSPQAMLLSAIEESQLRPRQIEVRSPLLESRLAPLTGALGISLRRVKRLATLDNAARSLNQHFRRRG